MKRLFLLMVFLAVSIQSDAAKMSSYTNNTTPNGDVYFVGVDPNDISQTANGSNYRYSLNSILNLGLLDAVFNSLSIAGTGDSWIELENNTSFSDSIAGKYGLRFYNGALQQIINGTATDIGSASVIQRSSDPIYTDLSAGQIAVSTSSGDMFIKTSTGMYTFAGSYAADPTPPLLTAVSIAADGVTVTKTFSEAVSQGAGYSDTHFNIDASVTGNDIGETYVSGSGTNSWTFTAASTILQDETVNFDFSGVANSMEDSEGTDMAAVTDYAVTNGSTQTGGTTCTTDIYSYTGAYVNRTIVGYDDNHYYIGMKYTPNINRTVCAVTANMKYSSGTVSNNTYTMRIFTLSSNNLGTLIASSNGVVGSNLWNNTPVEYEFPETPTLLSGTPYYIVCDIGSGTSTNLAGIAYGAYNGTNGAHHFNSLKQLVSYNDETFFMTIKE